MMPAVSVIIPTFNRARLIERTIRSVLSQTYRDFEIIIVDDASTDNTHQILEDNFSPELNTETLRYLKNEQNLERSRSRNKGMAAASGQYIAFLDDDDIWLPNHIETLMQYLKKNPDVSCAFSKPLWLHEDGSVEDKLQRIFRENSTTASRDLCITGNMVFSPSSLFRKDIFVKIGGFREDLTQNEDWEFFSRIAMNFNIGYTNTVTCLFNAHSGSYSKITVGDKAYIKEIAWKIIEENSSRYNYHIKDELIGRICINLAENFIPVMKKSGEYFFKALKADSRLVFQYLTWKLFTRIILGRSLYLKLKYNKNYSNEDTIFLK